MLEVGICTLLIFIMNRALKVRSRLINKQNIFVENSRALMIGIDRTGKVDLCNPAMCRLLRMKQDEVLEHFFWEVGAKVSGEAVDQIFQLLAGRKKNGAVRTPISGRPGDFHVFGGYLSRRR
ncbi:hypothetical protein HMSSN036_17900 [Paenibacillus macerans]|nr:hypothetical protein HMSSN036_17900 [Paenibacillus macerans]